MNNSIPAPANTEKPAFETANDAGLNAARHTRSYRIRNDRVHLDAPRQFEVHASPEQVRHLEEEGYVVRERLVQGELLQQLRDAADEIEAEELAHRKAGEGGGFGGLFVRNLFDRHPTFLQMMNFAPTLSVARAVLGPQVQVHAMVLRVAYPELKHQQVEWHFHQRVVPNPEPSFFFRPVVLDNLIYLDDITLETGPLVVMPRTHLHNDDLPGGDHSDKPGQVVVTVPAGSCVTSHSSLWHKAMPTLPGGTKRRLLILGYSPVWMKQIDKPGGGLTDTLLPDADEETRELLGLSGYY
jgi:ectoine hydroxylase-related dioxygenase (phytanoyl-CoA dioxygenase family)